MNKILEVIEAHKLYEIDIKKFEIVIHPESLIHAVIEFKNGLYKFIYHETTMLIPLASAIFDKDVDIKDYLKPKKNSKNSISYQNLNLDASFIKMKYDNHMVSNECVELIQILVSSLLLYQ